MAERTSIRAWRSQGKGRRPVSTELRLEPVQGEAARGEILDAVPEQERHRIVLLAVGLDGLTAPVTLSRRFRWRLRRPLYYWGSDRDLFLENITFDLDVYNRVGGKGLIAEEEIDVRIRPIEGSIRLNRQSQFSPL